jgi:hypothetical protein
VLAAVEDDAATIFHVNEAGLESAFPQIPAALTCNTTNCGGPPLEKYCSKEKIWKIWICFIRSD